MKIHALSSCRVVILSIVLLSEPAAMRLQAHSMEPRLYDTGSPALTDIWVDRDTGNDANNGNSRMDALATINEAWNRIPQADLTGTGYRIAICAGTYGEGEAPQYWQGRHGTYACPVVLMGADGPGMVTLPIVNVYDCQYLYLDALTIEAGGGDALHFEKCGHILVRNCVVRGVGDIDNYEGPQEALKVNQCQYVYIENSDISGGWDNAVDFVAVQYGHIVANRIHRAREWCVYLKGGSACFRIEGNEIYDGQVGGFSAGQGSGMEFMVSPWLHYEAYDIKFFSNVIYNIGGAGMGVNGGYNILLAHNTLFHVGGTSHGIEVVFGLRGCDGDAGQCAQYIAAGGWGTATVGNQEPIPNRNVYIYNNLLLNPSGYSSAWKHFAVYGPMTPSPGSNVPSPARADDNLRIRGNLIWNGPADLPLGVEESDCGCRPDNPTCSADQLRSDNTINSLLPVLDGSYYYRPAAGSAAFNVPAYDIPDFPGGDQPSQPAVPAGNLSNQVPRDFYGNPRVSSSPVGAHANATTSADGKNGPRFQPRTVDLLQNYPNPFNSETMISFVISARSDIRLVLCDLKGKEIACMASGNYDAGPHRVRLDGVNLDTGSYFYKLTAGGASRVRKLMVVR